MTVFFLTRSGRGLIAAPMIDAATILTAARRRRIISGTGGRLRLRSSPLPPDLAPAASSFSRDTRSDPAAPSSSRSLPRCIRRHSSSPIGPRAWRLREARGFGRSAHGTATSRSRPRCRSASTIADDGTPSRLFHVARGNALAGLADGKIALAAGGQRRGRLCIAGLVRLARSGADLALSGRASDGHGHI